jgi:hypothetical protein
MQFAIKSTGENLKDDVRIALKQVELFAKIIEEAVMQDLKEAEAELKKQ